MNASLRRRMPIVAVVCALGLALFPMPDAVGGGTPTVIASGLRNPRGLAGTDAADFFVVEAGKGGTAKCGEGPVGQMCSGRTGRITHVLDGALDPLTRLSSIALEDGSTAFGPHDMAVTDGGNGLRHDRPRRSPRDQRSVREGRSDARHPPPG